MAVKNIVQAVTLTSLASASVTAAFQAVNTSGLPNACFMIKIINNSSEDVTVSYDGTNAHDYGPTLSTALLSVQNNAQPNNFINNFPVGTKVYVKGTAGTGNIYVAGYYQPSAN